MSSREAHTLYAHWTFLHEHCICGGDTAAGDHTAHTAQTFTAWNGTDAISYTNKTAYVYLSQNVTINSNLVVDGTTLYLCLSGNTSTAPPVGTLCPSKRAGSTRELFITKQSPGCRSSSRS